MTAHAPIRTPEQIRQSLLAVCKERRWLLLQAFAALEIALGESLSEPAKTFGAKVRARIKADSGFKRFESLIATRNLVAHAHVSTSEYDGKWATIWRMADGECNAAVMSVESLDKWHDATTKLLNEARKALEV